MDYLNIAVKMKEKENKKNEKSFNTHINATAQKQNPLFSDKKSIMQTPAEIVAKNTEEKALDYAKNIPGYNMPGTTDGSKVSYNAINALYSFDLENYAPASEEEMKVIKGFENNSKTVPLFDVDVGGNKRKVSYNVGKALTSGNFGYEGVNDSEREAMSEARKIPAYSVNINGKDFTVSYNALKSIEGKDYRYTPENESDAAAIHEAEKSGLEVYTDNFSNPENSEYRRELAKKKENLEKEYPNISLSPKIKKLKYDPLVGEIEEYDRKVSNYQWYEPAIDEYYALPTDTKEAVDKYAEAMINKKAYNYNIADMTPFDYVQTTLGKLHITDEDIRNELERLSKKKNLETHEKVFRDALKYVEADRYLKDHKIEGLVSDKLVQYVEQYVNSEKANIKNTRVAEASDGVIGGTVNTVATVLGAPLKAVGLIEPVAAAIQGRPIDPNSDFYDLSNASETIRRTVRNNISENNGVIGTIGAVGYDLATNLGDFAVNMAVGKNIGAAIGGAAGLSASATGKISSATTQALMSSSAASDTIKQAKRDGASDSQAVLLGVAAGTVEAIFEKFSIERFNVFKSTPVGQSRILAVAKNTVKGFFPEGTEELSTNIANLVFDGIIMGENSSYNRRVKELTKGGMDKLHAEMKATGELAGDALYDFLLGGLSGSFMNAGATLMAPTLSKRADYLNGYAKQITSVFPDAKFEYLNPKIATEQDVENFAKILEPYEKKIIEHNKKVRTALISDADSKIDKLKDMLSSYREHAGEELEAFKKSGASEEEINAYAAAQRDRANDYKTLIGKYKNLKEDNVLSASFIAPGGVTIETATHIDVTDSSPAIIIKSGKKYTVIDEDGYIFEKTAQQVRDRYKAVKSAKPAPEPTTTDSAGTIVDTEATVRNNEPSGTKGTDIYLDENVQKTDNNGDIYGVSEYAGYVENEKPDTPTAEDAAQNDSNTVQNDSNTVQNRGKTDTPEAVYVTTDAKGNKVAYGENAELLSDYLDLPIRKSKSNGEKAVILNDDAITDFLPFDIVEANDLHTKAKWENDSNTVQNRGKTDTKKAVNVGDTFTDTKNGDTIKVVSRDDTSTTLEFTDKDGNVATSVFNNNAVDIMNTNPRYVKSETVPGQNAKVAPAKEVEAVQPTVETAPTAKGITSAYTNGNQKIDLKYKVVSLDDLVVSNNEDGTVNPEYPQELQPRERTRQASILQVQNIAKNIVPEKLGESANVSDGSPIVNSDNVVESGNGRTIALSLMYKTNPEGAKKYIDFIKANAEKFGIDADNLPENPILVRERLTDVDRVEFVKQANESNLSAMSATELAKSDAERLTSDILNLLAANDDGNINTAENKAFVSRVISEVFSQNDLNSVVNANGMLSANGLERIRNALFYKAYNDAGLASKLSESLDSDIKNITNVLVNIAPKIVQIKNGIANGSFYDLDFSQDIVDGIKYLQEAKRQNLKVKNFANQITMVDDVSKIVKYIAYFFEQKNRGAKQCTLFFNHLCDIIISKDPNQLAFLNEDVKTPTKERIFNEAIDRYRSDEQGTGIDFSEMPGIPWSEESRQADDSRGNEPVAGGSTESASVGRKSNGTAEQQGHVEEKTVVGGNAGTQRQSEGRKEASPANDRTNETEVGAGGLNPKSNLVKKRSVAPKTSVDSPSDNEKAKNAESPTKLEDFGEKIGGARKDLWSSRGLIADDLEGMNDREREKNVKKDNVWKRPDYRVLIKEGRNKGILWAVNEIRKSLPQSVYYGYKPTAEEKSEKQKLFVETIREIQSMAENAKSKADFEAMGEKWLIDNGYLEDTGKTYNRYSYTKKYSKNPALLGSNYLNTVRYLAKNFDTLEILANRDNFATDKKTEIPKGFSIIGGEKSVGKKLENGEWVEDTSYGVAKGNVIIKTGFVTKEEALEWLKQGIAQKKKKTRFVPEQLLEIHRKGPDYRKNKNIDGQDYIGTFGFKGGEFGNWMNAKDRQVSLDYGFDALKDLADALNIADADISFDGNLNIAFGARGQGLSGAAAHYENERRVINLTKMNGAGSLAHEWFHALDDFIGGYTSNYATEHYYSLPEKTKNAIRDLITAMQYKDATQEETDLTMQKKYEQAVKGITNILANEFRWVDSVEKGTFKESDAKYYSRMPTAEDAKVYRELLNKLIETGEYKYVERLSELRKEINGHVISKDIRDSFAWRLIPLKSAKSDSVQKSRKMTDFYTGSRRFGEIHSKDGDYWDSTVEMASRAFACYIADKTNKQNDYLTAHSDSAVTLDMDKDGNPVIVRAYPVGEEREAINSAFDNLIDALKSDGFLHEREKTQKPDEISYFVDGDIDIGKTENLSEESLFRASDEVYEKFGEQIDNWLDGKMVSSELFELGQTPVVLQGIGAKNLPIVMGQNVMLKMTGEKHSISLDEIAQLPDAIADPIMVFKSATVPNSYVILTKLTDKQGDDVVVAMHLERYLGFNKINRISSVYGKENVGSFVEKQISDGNLKYIEKNKSREWLRSRGLYLPKLNTILDLDNSILEKSDIVNRFGEKNISKNENFVDSDAKRFTRKHSENDIAFAEQLALSRGYTLETFYDADLSVPAITDRINRVVRLNLASYRNPIDLLGHELFHTLSEADQQSLVRYFKLNAKTDTEEFKTYKEKTMRDYQKANDMYKDGKEFTETDFWYEFAAENCRTLFTDRALADEIANRKPSLAKRILDTFRRLWYSITGKSIYTSTEATKAAQITADTLAKAEKMYAEALKTRSLELPTNSVVKPNMSDADRFDVLKDKIISAVYYDKEKVSDIDLSKLNSMGATETEKFYKKLGEKLGIFKQYHNNDIDISFEFSKGGMSESLHKQGKALKTFNQMLSVLDDIAENAVCIEVHDERYDNPRSTVDTMYILVSAFENEEGIVPVRLTVKTFVDNTTNKLHVVISTSEVTGIKKSRGQGITWDRSKETAAHYSRPAFDISIADLFANVNPLDVDFLKYVPNGFLNEEQLTAKEKGVKKTEAYIAKKNERYASPITISTTEEAHAADIGFEEPDYNDNLDFFVDNETSESVEAETSSALDRIMGKVSENKKKADKEKGVNQGYIKDNKNKVAAVVSGLKEAIAQSSRTLRYIPERGERGTFFAEARKTILNYKRAGDLAQDSALTDMQRYISLLNADEFKLFETYVILKDMEEDIERNGEDILLPNGFKAEDVIPAIKEAEAGMSDNVRKAFEERQRVFGNTVRNYVEYNQRVGFDTANRFTRENYFHHEVIEYTNSKKGKGQASMHINASRGYLKTRNGTSMDIDTDLLRVDYETLRSMKHDTYRAKALHDLKLNYDIKDELQKRATQENAEMLVRFFAAQSGGKFDVNGKPDSEASRKTTEFNKQIGKQFGQLITLAKDGKLPDVSGRFATIVKVFADGKISNNAELYTYLAELSKGVEGYDKKAVSVARDILKHITQKNSYIREILGNKYQTWETILERDYSDTYTIVQPRVGRNMYSTEVIDADKLNEAVAFLVDKMLIGDTESTSEELKTELARTIRILGAPYQQWVLPNEIAAQIETTANTPPPGKIAKFFKGILNAWKRWVTGLNPFTRIKYWTRNVVGDFDAVLAGAPGIAKKIPQAIRELTEAFSKDGTLSKDLVEWKKRGGYQQLHLANELDSNAKKRIFANVTETSSREGWGKILPVLKELLTGNDFNEFREAILRYSAFLYFDEKIKNDGGVTDYVASNRRIIQGLKNNTDKAYQMANDLLGAYDQVSVGGQYLRNFLIPFYSFTETNFKRYTNLIYNAILNDAALGQFSAKKYGRAGAVMLKKFGMRLIQMNLLGAFCLLWNNLVMGDIEKELSESVQRRPHIVFGKIGDTILSFDRIGSWAEFLEWFGMDSFWEDRIHGDSVWETVANIPTDALDKAINMSNPYVKLFVELLFGKSMYPSATSPSNIRDRWEYAVDNLTGGVGGDIYNMMSQRPSRGIGYSAASMFVYLKDFKESAYNDVLYEYIPEWQHKDGETSNFSYKPDAKANALYYMKKAIRYKDKSSALVQMDKYFELGGTPKSLLNSIDNLSPLKNLGKKRGEKPLPATVVSEYSQKYGISEDEVTERFVDFISTLNDNQKDKLVTALDYYRTDLAIPLDLQTKLEKLEDDEIEKAKNLLHQYIDRMC